MRLGQVEGSVRRAAEWLSDRTTLDAAAVLWQVIGWAEPAISCH
jgi:hypothetical protein